MNTAYATLTSLFPHLAQTICQIISMTFLVLTSLTFCDCKTQDHMSAGKADTLNDAISTKRKRISLTTAEP